MIYGTGYIQITFFQCTKDLWGHFQMYLLHTFSVSTSGANIGDDLGISSLALTSAFGSGTVRPLD